MSDEVHASNVGEQYGFDFTIPYQKPVRLWSVDELYDGMSRRVAVDASEDQRIERKSATYRAKDLGDYFSMWANTPPDGGLILIGVENDGRISGTMRVDQVHINELQRAGDIFAADARYQLKMVALTNDKEADDQILAIRVFYRQDKVVETASGNTFTRAGSSKRLMTEDERRELQHLKGQLEVEREPVKLAYPGDFNEVAIQQFAAAVALDRRLPERSAEEILQLRRLGKIGPSGFQPTLACALLFARDPIAALPGCKIRFFRFQGTEELTGKDFNAVKSIWLEGTIPELIKQAEEVVEAQIREFMRLGRNNQFESVAEYPKDAWYEAIVNACVHRSYSLRNMHITIKMFDDRLEVESPGAFPPLVTPDNIYDMHVPRNPDLMDALYYMKYVLAANEGTRRIKESMVKLGLPEPTFKQTHANAAYVRVTLQNDVEHRKTFVDTEAYLVLGAQLSSNLTEDEKRIVNHLCERGTINVTEAARICGRRWQAAKKILSSLTERGIVDHVHSKIIERDANAYFVLKKRFTDKLKG